MQKKLISLVLLLISSTALHGHIRGVLWYTTPLSLNLVKENYDAFLDDGKNKPEDEWRSALLDVILLETSPWYKNPTNIKKLLKDLHKCVHARIQKIENQLLHKYRYDYGSLVLGTTCLAIGVGCAALAWSIYRIHKKDLAEHAAIMDRLEKDGVSIKITDLWLFVSFAKKQSHHDDAKRLQALINATRHYNNHYIGFLGGAAGFTVISLLAAVPYFQQALNPDQENKYLSRYKNLLKLVEQLQQEDCIEMGKSAIENFGNNTLIFPK